MVYLREGGVPGVLANNAYTNNPKGGILLNQFQLFRCRRTQPDKNKVTFQQSNNQPSFLEQ